MKFNKKLFLFSLFLFLLLCIFYTTTLLISKNNSEKEFMSFLENLNDIKKSKINSVDVIDLSPFMDKDIDNDIFTEEELEELTNFRYTTQADREKVLTFDEASEDINYAFKLLKHVYGAYEYFGGDKVFLPKKEIILKELSTLNEIKLNTLSKLLIENLSFIRDAHFRIGSYYNINDNKMVYAYNEEFIFKKDEVGYYTKIYNSKWYISSIENENIEEFIKPTISPNGELSYTLGTLINNLESYYKLDLDLINYKTKETLIKEITLEKDLKTNKDFTSSFEEDIITGIPILKLNKMSPLNSKDNSLDEFVKTAEKLKNEELLIIDLRGNRGGSDNYWMEWMENYLGSKIEINSSLSKKVTKAYLQSHKRNFEKGFGNEGFANFAKESLENENYGYWWKNETVGEWKENKNLIFILVDNSTASAGESMLPSVKNLENVIVVGTNSEGCSLTPDLTNFLLPNSHLDLGFGIGLFFRNVNENIDGIGYEPDLWVNSSDVLNRVIKLYEYYNIN